MKNLILTIILFWLSQQMVFGQCAAATNLSHQFSNGINTFSWDQVQNATQYDLWVQEAGGSGWEYITTTTNNTFLTPGGVLSGSYEFYISVTCQNGDVFDSSTFPFTIPCLEPTNLVATNITQTGATLLWTNFYQNDPIWPMGVLVAYRPLGTGSWIPLNVNPLSSSYTMANLQPNTTYEWCVNLDCPYFDSAPVISQFTTLQTPCLPPLAPTLFAFTNNSLQVQWSSPWTASYLLEYKSVNASGWTSITTNSNTMYTITGLSPATSYQVRVARICGTNQVSLYSSVSTFTTNCVTLNNSAAHIRYFQLNGFVWTSGADPNGYLYGNALIPVESGNSYTLRLAGGGQINNGNRYNVAVYLDANQNYVYETSERVFGVGFLSNTNAKNFTFTVPSTALAGTTRLRVIILKQNQGSITPCPVSGSLGEVEDYTIVVSPPASNKNTQITENKIGQTLDTELYTSTNKNTSEIKADEISDDTFGFERSSGIRADDEDTHNVADILISPNPVADFCTLKGQNIHSVRIVDAVGKVISEQKNEANNAEMLLDLTLVKAGMYFVEVFTSDGKRSVKKVVKL